LTPSSGGAYASCRRPVPAGPSSADGLAAASALDDHHPRLRSPSGIPNTGCTFVRKLFIPLAAGAVLATGATACGDPTRGFFDPLMNTDTVSFPINKTCTVIHFYKSIYAIIDIFLCWDFFLFNSGYNTTCIMFCVVKIFKCTWTPIFHMDWLLTRDIRGDPN
jgi:hypothetical protein